jgi:hypothetical protein
MNLISAKFTRNPPTPPSQALLRRNILANDSEAAPLTPSRVCPSALHATNLLVTERIVKTFFRYFDQGPSRGEQ